MFNQEVIKWIVLLVQIILLYFILDVIFPYDLFLYILLGCLIFATTLTIFTPFAMLLTLRVSAPLKNERSLLISQIITNDFNTNHVTFFVSPLRSVNINLIRLTPHKIAFVIGQELNDKLTLNEFQSLAQRAFSLMSGNSYGAQFIKILVLHIYLFPISLLWLFKLNKFFFFSYIEEFYTRTFLSLSKDPLSRMFDGIIYYSQIDTKNIHLTRGINKIQSLYQNHYFYYESIWDYFNDFHSFAFTKVGKYDFGKYFKKGSADAS